MEKTNERKGRNIFKRRLRRNYYDQIEHDPKKNVVKNTRNRQALKALVRVNETEDVCQDIRRAVVSVCDM